MTDNTLRDRALLREALGNIDAKYIEGAMKPPRRAIRQRRWRLVAACLAGLLAVGMSIRILPTYLRYVGGAVFFDSEATGGWLVLGPQDPSAPPLPWEESLYFKGEVEDRSLRPSEPVTLHLSLGLKDEVLGQGSLRVTIAAPDFDVAITGDAQGSDTLTVEDPAAYTAEAPLDLTVTLTPTWGEEGWALGEMYVTVAFVPADKEAFVARMSEESVFEYAYPNWQESLFSEDGALRLEYLNISYAGNRVETRVGTSGQGSTYLWQQMLEDHYGSFRLSGREATEMYYANLYRGRVSAQVSRYMTDDPEMLRYEYFSANIRYESAEFTRDPELWAAYLTVIELWESYPADPETEEQASRVLAEMILERMYQSGVITPEEYTAELDNLQNATQVGIGMVGHGLSDRFFDVINRYRYTHKD